MPPSAKTTTTGTNTFTITVFVEVSEDRFLPTDE